MAAPPGYRTLDLTLISAKDLKDVSGLFSSKMECYAVVSLSGDPRSRQRTPTDHEGNRDPTWNSPLKFYVPAVPGPASGGLVLEVAIRCEKALGDKDVGEVHIPVRELESDAAGGGKGEASVRFLSYQVRRPSGNPKGVLNFSYKFGDAAVAAAPPPPPPPVAAPVGYPPPAAGAPYGYPPPPAAAYPPPSSSSSSASLAADHKSDKPVDPYPSPQAAIPYAAPAYPPQPGAAYPAYPPPGPAYGAPPPPAPGYGYPPAPPPAGYGYPPPPPYGYAGQPVAPQQPPKKGNKFGLGLGAGLLGGALGGLLIGDAISDASAYDAGYDAGFDDGGGFDF